MLVAGLLVLALGARIGVVVANPGFEPRNDASDYARHAMSIAAGDGYPPTAIPGAPGASALRPPGYPYFLGGVFAVSGDTVDAGRVAQAVLGVVVVALAGIVAALVWGPSAGILTVAVAAVYPPLVVSGASLGAEPLFLAFELGAVATALLLRRSRSPWWAVVTGVLWGLALLTRTNGAVLVLPLVIAAWPAPRRSPWTARLPALVLAAAALTVAPWTIRNAFELDAFVPVADQDGFTLAGTYNDTSRSDPRFRAAWRPPNLDPHMATVIERHAHEGELALNAKLRSEARGYAADDPGYIPDVAWQNSLRLFYLGGQDYNRLATSSELGLGAAWSDLAVYGFVPFSLLAIAGCFVPAARRAPGWLWLVPLTMLASAVLLNASPRFRLPADPFIAMLAALALGAVLPSARGRPPERA